MCADHEWSRGQMTRQKLIRGSVAIFGMMLLCTMLQSYAIAQLVLPFAVRSILVVYGGATLGLIASRTWIIWLQREAAGSGHR